MDDMSQATTDFNFQCKKKVPGMDWKKIKLTLPEVGQVRKMWLSYNTMNPKIPQALLTASSAFALIIFIRLGAIVHSGILQVHSILVNLQDRFSEASVIHI